MMELNVCALKLSKEAGTMPNHIPDDSRGAAANGRRPAVIQVTGYKNAGKTELVCRLVDYYKRESLRVGTIKHDAHDFDMDKPGTDTWKHQQAGADMTAITSPHRTVLIRRSPETLERLVAAMYEAELLLVEGFKEADYPKLVLLRREADLPLIGASRRPVAWVVWPEIERSAALRAALEAAPGASSIPLVSIDHVEEMARLIRPYLS